METLRMSRKERHRLELLSRVQRGELRLSKAAELLKLSYRQAKRVYRRYRELKDAGLVHRLRGRASNHRLSADRRAQVLSLYREKYADFGPTLASEYLASEDKQKVSVTSLRRWLLEAGLWTSRRRHSEHRRWRARKECVGEMVQMDGSHHDWFEGRREWAVMMVMIDDATNHTYARFFEEETTVAAMMTFGRYVERHGLPRSLYVDRDSIYKPTRAATVDEELAETGPLTQFGRAMKELDVDLICAHSPQAKGRVERRHGVFQDRLVKALRLAGISDLESANQLLEETFLPELNRRFTVEPQQAADVHRRLPREISLDRVLCFQEERVVQNDWTVLWRRRCFQLTEANQTLALVRQWVLVCEHLDGTIRLRYQGRELAWQELSERPARASSLASGMTGLGRVGQRPAADHPWRGRRRAPFPAASAGPPCSASVASVASLPAQPSLRKAGQPKKEKIAT
jgi:transposase